MATRPHDPLFDDAWLKLGWGFEHAKRAIIEIDEYQNSQNETTGGVSLGYKYDSKANLFTMRVDDLVPIPKRFSLLIGDVLHCYRSALDAAVWAAVQRGSKFNALDEYHRRNVSFPDILRLGELPAKYTTLEDRFERNTLPEKAPGVLKEDARVLRLAQRFDLAESDRIVQPLALLTEKNNIDKHKALEVLGRKSAGMTINVADQLDCVVNRIEARPGGDVLEVGTELAYIHVTPTGLFPRVRVQATFPHAVALEYVPEISSFLNDIGKMVQDVLLEFSEAPPNDQLLAWT